MRSRRSLLAVLVAGALATPGGCKRDANGDASTGAAAPLRHGLTPEQAAETLAVVGDRVITVGELAERLAEQSPYLRARYNSPERRREFLDNMIRFELLAQEARRRGYDRLPEVVHARKQMMIQQMMRRDFEERIALSSITEEEIRAHYEANIDEFHKPEQVRASHILVKNRAAAERILRQLLARPHDVELFRQMAERHNEDPETRERLGDLRFFSRPAERSEGEPEVPAAVAEAAFQIREIGGYHPNLVQSDAGFHIVKLTGRRAALRRTLEDARRAIQQRLWREKREAAVEELLARLRQEIPVEVFPERLEDVRVEVPEGNVPTESIPGLGSTATASPPPTAQREGER
ncbi:MAG: peptidyl-prolyl cis-trans isomerase [Myxococcota bacterium]|nr:peptidyl-prolyl cis-trans isomerase [Myxococcota bacterium]MDW8363084.1 peptidyl-prolyl cis-trans isomerase [Myxococcales bacterium]